ncbi:aminoglycoside phosphotransferase family protein [Yinghuangia sp. ASG 101]|uniref:aminoglycoside phosphotransferase family protein n=1 Tax=Yinghuangia sp. ASG 101 TaxID=2896848 RepID=UPI001E50A020|nr:aminoglycoside phosphotransferase family protein [Yinghuangia sp. ASG 101]UGQ10979.1 aminoglycoside phosphotransferase family protein [Yinghuangia sp. ASG 101]
MSSSSSVSAFSEASGRAALVEGARQVGLRPVGVPELLGPVADNAVFRLAPGVVGRVASSDGALERVRIDLAVSMWLAGQGVSAVRALEGVVQPVVVAGRVVSFWHEVEQATMASAGELGALLASLHRLVPPTAPELPVLEPFVRVREHLAAARAGLPSEDMAFLHTLHNALKAAYSDVEFSLPWGPIHGDPNRKNAVRGADGHAVLLDLERFSVGPREWDLVVPAVYHRLGWYSAAEYEQFTGTYGLDVREWSGFEVLASIRMFRMTAWLASRVPREPRLLEEARLRIDSLRHPELSRTWTPGA